MICELTTKKFKLLPKEDRFLEHLLYKIERYLPKFAPDLPYINLVLKKNLNKGEFFEGRIKLFLPKRTLAANFSGRTPKTLLKIGFDKISKEFDTYKARHFKGSSKYRSHESVRTESFGGEII